MKPQEIDLANQPFGQTYTLTGTDWAREQVEANWPIPEDTPLGWTIVLDLLAALVVYSLLQWAHQDLARWETEAQQRKLPPTKPQG